MPTLCPISRSRTDRPPPRLSRHPLPASAPRPARGGGGSPRCRRRIPGRDGSRASAPNAGSRAAPRRRAIGATPQAGTRRRHGGISTPSTATAACCWGCGPTARTRSTCWRWCCCPRTRCGSPPRRRPCIAFPMPSLPRCAPKPERITGKSMQIFGDGSFSRLCGRRGSRSRKLGQAMDRTKMTRRNPGTLRPRCAACSTAGRLNKRIRDLQGCEGSCPTALVARQSREGDERLAARIARNRIPRPDAPTAKWRTESGLPKRLIFKIGVSRIQHHRDWVGFTRGDYDDASRILPPRQTDKPRDSSPSSYQCPGHGAWRCPPSLPTGTAARSHTATWPI